MGEKDESLIRGCQAGDRQSWETLIRRYERMIYGIALRSNLSEEDAADLFQNVCLKLFKNLHKLRDDGHLRGWLITTAKRDAWRKSRQDQMRAMPPEELGVSMETRPSQEPLPLETLVQIEETQIVRMALEDLGDNCRTLIRLLYQTDPTPSYTEIARIMGISEGAIGPTRGRCLQKIKKILLEKGF